MRKLYLLVSMLFTGFVHAQIPGNIVSIEDAVFDKSFATRPAPVVKGRLRNLTADELKTTKISYSLVTPFGGRQDKRSATLHPDGSFSFTLDYPLPYQQIWFSAGDFFYVALIVNTSLNIDLDANKLRGKDASFIAEGVSYSGADAALTEYYNRHIMYKRKEQLALSSRKQKLFSIFPAPPVDSLLTAYNAIAAELKEIDDAFIKENPSPYAWVITNENESGYFSDLAPRFWGMQMPGDLFQKMKTHKNYLVSNDGSGYYNYLAMYIRFMPSNRVNVTPSDLLRIPGISADEKIALDSLVQLENAADADKQTLKRLRSHTSTLSNRIASERATAKGIHFMDSVFSPAKADLMKLQMPNNRDLNEALATLTQIQPSVHTPWIRKIIKSEQDKIRRNVSGINSMLASGGSVKNTSLPGKALLQAPFGASLYKATNIPLKTFLAQLKQSFPGKAIVIDRWATWCAPCLSEMPHSKQLAQESKDLPVVFVYLCTESGSDENKWRTKVAELKQPGLHYYIDIALDNEISEYFSFSGYPGYAFIDRQGKYKPGAIKWISEINKDKLAEMVK